MRAYNPYINSNQKVEEFLGSAALPTEMAKIGMSVLSSNFCLVLLGNSSKKFLATTTYLSLPSLVAIRDGSGDRLNRLTGY